MIAHVLSTTLFFAAPTLELPLTSMTSTTSTYAPTQSEGEKVATQAVTAFEAEEYEKAVELFERSYQLSPNPNILYNIGRTYEQTGDIASALEYYRRFLKEPDIGVDARETAMERVSVLRELVGPGENPSESEAEEGPTEPETPIDFEASSDPRPNEDETEEPAGRRRGRIAGYALIGTGGALLAAGGTLGGLAWAANRTATSEQEPLDERQAQGRRSERLAIGTDVLLATGGVAAVAGIALAVVFRKQSKGRASNLSRLRISPHFDERNVAVSLSGRF